MICPPDLRAAQGKQSAGRSKHADHEDDAAGGVQEAGDGIEVGKLGAVSVTAAEVLDFADRAAAGAAHEDG
jgi:hypothetical protein